jgi:caa(3)-type oxidase subunit IV
MHLREQGGLTRIAAVAALAWLAALIGLTEADVATRGLFRG